MEKLDPCPRCQQRGKTWNGGDLKCAFLYDSFDTDNWNCATANRIRNILEPHVVYHEDHSAVLYPLEDGKFILLQWYKSRGRINTISVIKCNGDIRPITLGQAERFILKNGGPEIGGS